MPAVLCLDVGSTYTKGVLVDARSGAPLAYAAHPSTVATDVMEGVEAVQAQLATAGDIDATLVCSSAGGGLRLAVVGYEREVSAEAGRRVGLSAGGKVVHITSGALDEDAVAGLRGSRPDLILLVGGTDGGNADTLLHNARILAEAHVGLPVVVAGNAQVHGEVAERLVAGGADVFIADNVVPKIGVIAPESARAALREAFLRHVIGGKGLSRGRGFTQLVRAATPDAVLSGVEVLAAVLGADVLVLDIGGATSDVYSVITPHGEDAQIARDVVAPLWQARTVEADLGMRWNAQGIVDAAAREGIALSHKAIRYAAKVATDTAHLAQDEAEWALEEDLATAAAVIAARRHGRPDSAGGRPRPLNEVAMIVGSGGVLRHSPKPLAQRLLAAVASDHGGGWRVPDRPRTGVDTAYLVFAVGLLSHDHPDQARALAAEILAGP